jgi:hypothetical protein
VAARSKGKNTHTAACDFIRGNKAVDLFPRIKSQAAGRSAPLYVCFYPKLCASDRFLAGIMGSNPAGSMKVCAVCSTVKKKEQCRKIKTRKEVRKKHKEGTREKC